MKKLSLTECDLDIISDALGDYFANKGYKGIFSAKQVEKTYFKVQSIWQKLLTEKEKYEL